MLPTSISTHHLIFGWIFNGRIVGSELFVSLMSISNSIHSGAFFPNEDVLSFIVVATQMSLLESTSRTVRIIEVVPANIRKRRM